MKIGLDVFLEKEWQAFSGKRVGLVTNMTGVNRQLIPSIDLFHEHDGINLTALYGPEHGIRGDAKEGEEIASSIDPYTGVPVYSLYGDSKKPSREMLEETDVIVFDLQDIGARYYTYIYTMAYMMEACRDYGKQFVVLDRPNPISGENVEGNLVEEGIRSFVGLYPIPNRHGMTVGELALFYKHELGIDCELTVVKMEGWERMQYFDETDQFWVPPSPNTTGIDMCTLYPGTCLVEGTNLSEGRGTTRPFEYIGAPYVEGYRLAKEFNSRKLPGLLARPVSFVPFYQKHEGRVCEGVQLHVSDRRKVESVRTGLALLETVADLYPEAFEFNEWNGKYFFDLLAGTRSLRDKIRNKETEASLRENQSDLERFKEKSAPYLLYN